MTVIQYSVLILIGLASGFAVASGIFAFITMLGIIPRLAARTKTANHVVWYETMIIAGGALGNIWIVFEIPMPLTSIFFGGLWAFCRCICRMSGNGTGGNAACNSHFSEPFAN